MSELSGADTKMESVWLLCFMAISILEGLASIYAILSIPGDPKNAFLLGFSLSRLAILFVLLLILGILSYLSFRLTKVHSTVTNLIKSDVFLSVVTAIGIIAAILLWITIWLPSKHFGDNEDIYLRLKPLLIYFELIGVQFFIFIKILTNSFSIVSTHFRPVFKALVISCLVLLGTWVFISISRIGLVMDTAYWNVPGIPLATFQYLGVTLAIIVVMFFFYRSKRSISRPAQMLLGIIIPLAIFLVTVQVWGSTPMLKHYFSLEPTPPNFQPYPYSDARVHDLGAISILKGDGIYFHGYTDKPLYAVFLAVLHLFSGNNYATLAWAQIIVLALIPVLLYLLGKRFHSQLFGLVLAALMILQQRNAIILSYKIASVNPKLLVTEEIMLLGIVLVVVLLFQWIRKRDQKIILILGAVIGALSLIRINPIFILPAVLLIVLLQLRKTPRILIKQIVLLMMGFLIVFSPWLITGVNPEGQSWFFLKIMDVINVRYTPQIETTSMNELPVTTNSNITYISQPGGAALAAPRNFANENLTLDEAMTSENSKSSAGNGVSQLAFIMVNHFLHNFSTSLLALPDNVYIDTTADLSTREYWQDGNHWNGSFPPVQYALIIGNLLLIAVGLGESWRRFRWAGLAPLIVFLAYDLSLGFAMNSGSRYIVPINWMVFFYYALGLIFIIRVILNFLNIRLTSKRIEFAEIEELDEFKPTRPLWPTFIVIALFAAIIPIANLVVPLLIKPAQERNIAAENISIPEQTGNQLVYGQILYPYYEYDGTAITFDFLSNKEVKTYILNRIYLTDKKVVLESDISAVLSFSTIQDKQELESIYLVEDNRPDLIWQKIR